MNHNFGGDPFTIGIEEELMLVDRETLDLAQGVEAVLADVGDAADGDVKPELMQSVLEIATEPCPNVGAAGVQLGGLRSAVRAAAERAGMLVGASGTHPSALWEEQRIVDRPRYRALTAELGYIARQELIFGTHVHVGVDGPDKAVYIADGLRRDLPLLLGLSANSPLWRGRVTGMMSSRTPVFRAFPRVGVPPHYGSWEIYERRVERMVSSGAISDYTYLWWDVRPHPNLGTVEVRVFDQQTRLEHTIALAAVVVTLVHRYASGFVEGQALIEVPGELIDDNKVRAALHGLEGELVDYRRGRNVATRELVARLLDELAPHADELGCASELGAIRELIDAGTGARHQLDLLERDGDLAALTRHLCKETAGAP
jgi:carboxylate-amine ligase